MCEVSKFFGISVKMKLSDRPGPNILASYNGDSGFFDFEGLPINDFKFPDTGKQIVESWTKPVSYTHLTLPTKA